MAQISEVRGMVEDLDRRVDARMTTLEKKVDALEKKVDKRMDTLEDMVKLILNHLNITLPGE